MNPSFTFEAGRLRLHLTWHTDRFAHSIGVLCGGRFMPLLASVEGPPDLQWPPSPPVQNVETGPQCENGQVVADAK